MSGDHERMDPIQHIIDHNDEVEERLAIIEAHDSALLAFATNFELVKKLSSIIGWENVPAEGRQLMRNYLGALVDGADAFIEHVSATDGPTTELTTLFREINEARDWLAERMEIH
ncbi:hypothetical protein D3273_24255 [Lichenibacterium minor]|uniref:Uncharacterized protein n=1 Tax=Lichenibacterium minor TaxID=2316528 RepID=A0A4Q2U117_9HYPH|nr:hypothetical protein [Lichenibacterium minor]RYC29358.1 hypothetical protein D3273_24255 [Lichenibacterium minor]